MDWLSATFKPKNTIAAVLRIWDIAGLVPNAHEGEVPAPSRTSRVMMSFSLLQGLGNAFLSNIQSVDGIYHVCRAFTDEDIVHTEGEVISAGTCWEKINGIFSFRSTPFGIYRSSSRSLSSRILPRLLIALRSMPRRLSRIRK